MKNMTISTKLFVGFGIILFLLILSIVLSMVSITNVNSQVDLYGKFTVPNTNSLWTIRRNLVSAQRYLLVAFISNSDQDTKNALAQAETDAKVALDILEQYSNNQRNHDRDEQIGNARSYMENAVSYRKEIESLLSYKTEENTKKAEDIFFNKYVPAFDGAANVLASFTAAADANADAGADNACAFDVVVDVVVDDEAADALLVVCAKLFEPAGVEVKLEVEAEDAGVGAAED
jgi:methyl-accepting chemotaxis protein